jgi:hypothetical protein
MPATDWPAEEVLDCLSMAPWQGGGPRQHGLLPLGKWSGIPCFQNGDVHLVVQARDLNSPDDPADRRDDYWIRCPYCRAEIFLHSSQEFRSGAN